MGVEGLSMKFTFGIEVTVMVGVGCRVGVMAS